MSEPLRTAKEILDAKVGPATTMRLEYLKNASRDGGSYIPSLWSSNRSYEQLALEGLVVEGPRSQPGWSRHWLVTDAGRAHLKDAVGNARD